MKAPIVWSPVRAGCYVHEPTGVRIEEYREQWIQRTFALDRLTGRTLWRVVLPTGEAKGRYATRASATGFAETCVTRLDPRYVKTSKATPDGFTESWLTLSQLLRTTDPDQHEAILAALDNPKVLGLHRISRSNVQLILDGDTEIWSRKRSTVHLKEGLTRNQLEDLDTVTAQALRWLSAHPAEDAFAAGRLFRISPKTIMAALKERQRRPICSKCGQVVKKGFFAG